MNQIKQVQRLNERELEKVVPSNASWHTDYRDTAYIYIGGLPLDLSEGDIITIFSQYGEPVWIRLMRDKETGKSKGFAWLKYEDQRSCDLAVDNLGGATVMGRLLAVDHTRYKKRDDEDETEGYVGQDRQVAAAQELEEEESEEEQRPMIKEEVELAKLVREHEDDDPMKAYMIEQKKEEVEKALKRVSRKRDDSHREKRHHRSRRDRSEEDDRKRRRRTSPLSEDDRRDRKERHRSQRHRSRTPTRDRSETLPSRRHRSTRDRSISPKREPSLSPRRERDFRRKEGRRSPSPIAVDGKSHTRRRERRRSSTPRRRDTTRTPSPRPGR